MSAPLRIAVFGSSGFVGLAIMNEIVQRGHIAVGVSRSGRPKHVTDSSWADQALWKTGDAFDPATYENTLQQVDRVVVSIGSPPVPTFSEEKRLQQLRMNGESTAIVMNTAKEVGVNRVVVMGAATPAWVAEGYRQGKERTLLEAESYAQTDPARSAVVFQPSLIYGTRYTPSGIPIPLWVVFQPLAFCLSVAKPILKPMAEMWPYGLHNVVDRPPVDVKQLAKAVVDEVLKDVQVDEPACRVIPAEDIQQY